MILILDLNKSYGHTSNFIGGETKRYKRNAEKIPALLFPLKQDLFFGIPASHIKLIKHLCRDCRTGQVAGYV